MITIAAQVAPEQRKQITQAIIAQYPTLDGKLQAISTKSVFRLAAVRGGQLPDGLTAQSVAAMITATTPPDTSHLAPMWSDRVGAAYARRMR